MLCVRMMCPSQHLGGLCDPPIHITHSNDRLLPWFPFVCPGSTLFLINLPMHHGSREKTLCALACFQKLQTTACTQLCFGTARTHLKISPSLTSCYIVLCALAYMRCELKPDCVAQKRWTTQFIVHSHQHWLIPESRGNHVSLTCPSKAASGDIHKQHLCLSSQQPGQSSSCTHASAAGFSINS